MAEQRLIDANLVKNAIREAMSENRSEELFLKVGEQICRMLDLAPTVDAVPVVHGRWVSVDGTQECDEWDCSVCERRLTFCEEINAEEVYELHHYCPTCGARMDGGNNNG